jgi:hypothetical protein
MKFLILSLATLVFAGPGMAQTPETKPEPKFYKLDIVLKELEAGKVLTSRAYVILLTSSGYSASVRTGDKVAVSTGGPQNTQFTYIDVGVNIDCRALSATATELGLSVTADVSSMGESKNGTQPPTVTQTRWNAQAVVPLRKPTMIFSADGASSKRQTQPEITATPLQ